ncbi:MAG: gamma-glutamyltransferase, partial [Bacteroidetes bacterium]
MQLLKLPQLTALVLAVVFSLPVVSQTYGTTTTTAKSPVAYQIVKQKTVQKQAVASAHPLASEVGNQIMTMGGNAFDAAIATQFALAVVYPNAGNLGGGGFLLARTTDGKTTAIDYREKAPSKASRDMYIDEKGVAQTNLSQWGHLASGVPGTIAGIAATLPMAKLPLQKLIEPAIQLAKNGFIITESEANNLNETKAEFLQHNTQPTAFVKPNNGVWKQGDTLIQPELAATLLRLQQYGLKEFYTGKTADLIVAEMQRGKGIISKADLQAYQPAIRQALTVNYRNHQVICFPPPSSGGLLLAQMLQMVEPFPMSTWGFHNPKTVQLMVEVERRAYADRAAHMGDPDYYKVPVKTLVSKPYLDQRMASFIPGKATPSTAIPAGTISTSEETTHISIVDKNGNCVSVTTTLNGSYGSKTVVGGAGFLLNNEMDDFSIKP